MTLENNSRENIESSFDLICANAFKYDNLDRLYNFEPRLAIRDPRYAKNKIEIYYF